MKNGEEYHPAWCQVVAHKWDSGPRGLLVTRLADVGMRTRCPECDRYLRSATGSRPKEHNKEPGPTRQAETVIPLRVVGLSHGVLFLAAGPKYQHLLMQTAVERATPLLVDGLRHGVLLRVDASRQEPLLVIQMDPRVKFRSGSYQVRLRRPLRRSAAKPYAVDSIEPAPRARHAAPHPPDVDDVES